MVHCFFARVCDGLNVIRTQREAGWHRQASFQSKREFGGLAAKLSFVACVDQRDRFHESNSTLPVSPLTRTRTPSPIFVVASRVPTTAGMPYSRATIAAWDS